MERDEGINWVFAVMIRKEEEEEDFFRIASLDFNNKIIVDQWNFTENQKEEIYYGDSQVNFHR